MTDTPPKPKLIYVEDTPDWRTLFGLQHRESGYEIIYANNLQEFIERVLPENPDARIIVSDVECPRSGPTLQWAEQYIQTPGHIPLVLTSSRDYGEIAQKLGVPFVDKSDTTDVYLAAINQAIAAQTQTPENRAGQFRQSPPQKRDPLTPGNTQNSLG